MKSKVQIIYIFTLLIMVASSTAIAGDPTIYSENPNVEKFVTAPATSLGSSYESITSLLGKPLRQKEEKIYNKHNPDQIDLRRTIVYSYVTITVYEVPAYNKSILESVDATGELIRISNLINFGAAKEKVIEVFGPPSYVINNEISYKWAWEETEDTVSFKFNKNKLSRIVWSFFLD